jgi:large subunit ribosomal protein L18
VIRVKLKRGMSHKLLKRRKNKARIRKKVDGSSERPRLAVYKSARHIYAQLVDDSKGQTLLTVSTLTDEIKGVKKTEAAKQIGQLIAKRALEKKIKTVVFDRSGFVFHGRIKAVADGAREAGLSF